YIIVNSSSSVDVEASQGKVGGLVGAQPQYAGTSKIKGSTASGKVTATGGSEVGGLVGHQLKKMTIEESKATATVTVKSGS
ncbi:MAG: GLUG motif-containing protein, partial [Bradymonadaceae bacterium]